LEDIRCHFFSACRDYRKKRNSLTLDLDQRLDKSVDVVSFYAFLRNQISHSESDKAFIKDLLEERPSKPDPVIFYRTMLRLHIDIPMPSTRDLKRALKPWKHDDNDRLIRLVGTIGPNIPLLVEQFPLRTRAQVYSRLYELHRDNPSLLSSMPQPREQEQPTIGPPRQPAVTRPPAGMVAGLASRAPLPPPPPPHIAMTPRPRQPRQQQKKQKQRQQKQPLQPQKQQRQQKQPEQPQQQEQDIQQEQQYSVICMPPQHQLSVLRMVQNIHELRTAQNLQHLLDMQQRQQPQISRLPSSMPPPQQETQTARAASLRNSDQAAQPAAKRLKTNPKHLPLPEPATSLAVADANHERVRTGAPSDLGILHTLDADKESLAAERYRRAETRGSTDARSENGVPDTLLFRVVLKRRRAGEGAKEENVGFLKLDQNCSFADARVKIMEELDVEGVSWLFYLDNLGPVSRKQENSLGAMMPFLSLSPNTDSGTSSSPCPVIRIRTG
jgi:hypothetical protein